MVADQNDPPALKPGEKRCVHCARPIHILHPDAPLAWVHRSGGKGGEIDHDAEPEKP